MSFLDGLLNRIRNAAGDTLTKRSYIKFGAGLATTDDAVNDQTVVTALGGQSDDIDMADANHTLTPPQYANTMIKIVSPTNAGVMTIYLPDATNAQGYLMIVWAADCNGNALRVQDVAAGTFIDIADTMKAMVWVSALGVTRVGSDV